MALQHQQLQSRVYNIESTALRCTGQFAGFVRLLTRKSQCRGDIEEPTISGVYQESSTIRPTLQQVFAQVFIYRVSYEW